MYAIRSYYAQQDVAHHPPGEHMLGRRARRPPHRIALGRLHGERQRGRAVGDQVDPENLEGEQGKGHPEKRA